MIPVSTQGDVGEPAGWFDLDDADWYELDDAAAAQLNTEADKVFLHALRERAHSSRWQCDPDDTQARHVREQAQGRLRLLLTVCDDESSRLLMTFGLLFDGARIVGDEVHSRTHEFMAGTAAQLEAAGGPADLAERAADWFESLLDWPIERHVWGALERPQFEEWVLPPSRSLSRTRGGRPATPPDKIVQVRGSAAR